MPTSYHFVVVKVVLMMIFLSTTGVQSQPSFPYVGTSETCVFTVVGPRTILTAAHCVEEGRYHKIQIDGSEYRFQFVHSPYVKDFIHDLAIGISDTPILMNHYASLPKYVSQLVSGRLLQLHTETLGSFSIKINSSDDVLYVTRGKVLQNGESGSPAFSSADQFFKPVILAVGVRVSHFAPDQTYWIRVDSVLSHLFFKKMITKYNLILCGWNHNCKNTSEIIEYFESDLLVQDDPKLNVPRPTQQKMCSDLLNADYQPS